MNAGIRIGNGLSAVAGPALSLRNGATRGVVHVCTEIASRFGFARGIDPRTLEQRVARGMQRHGEPQLPP
jgi:hypothetical protein